MGFKLSEKMWENASFGTRAAAYLIIHKKLLENPEYLRLYNEYTDILVADLDTRHTLTDKEKETLKNAFEIFVRANRSAYPPNITIDEINNSLEKYRLFWKMQEDGAFEKIIQES